MKDRNELFETAPVPKALLSLALPTIISQMIVMIYNLADTLFIGRTGDPCMVAAASLAYVLFFMLNALANLFGIGGGSLISRLLGAGRQEEARSACAFSFYGTALFSAAYALLCLVLMEPLLRLIGASDGTLGYASDYTLWVVVIGGIPATLSLTASHLLRSEGHGREAGIGLSLGSLLNIALDPLFMFVLLPAGQEITGAAVATCLSNTASLAYSLAVLYRMRRSSVLSLSPGLLREGRRWTRDVFAVGFPSAVSSVLVCVAIMVTNALAAAYGDIPVAAIGIVKKLEMLPHNVGTGLCQGMIPLAAYSYASGNHDRLRRTVSLTRRVGLVFTACCILLFELLSRPLATIFIANEETVDMTARFLRMMCLATPLTVTCFHATYTLQAMGKGRESLLLACCRQGAVLIPLLFLMNALLGLDGLVWTQLAADAVTAAVSTVLLERTMKRVGQERRSAGWAVTDERP